MKTVDFVNTLLLLVLTLLVSIAYIIRVKWRGRAHFDRVEQQVGSPLLSKDMMEMAYWSLQPLGRFFAVAKV
ncbi:MAG: hypothetical protein HY537_03795, partial [Deltaproteobacteria bacterium]|nr:hypothetical protein [Deltaproteobacteria bacterium]